VKVITIKQNKLVETAIQDGAYDNNKNFQFLSFRGIQPSMKIRKNSGCRKKTIITFEIRLYNHRKLIYNNGRLVRFMARDGW
jgi:hypothetical protein